MAKNKISNIDFLIAAMRSHHPKIIFFGETHGFLDDIGAIKSVTEEFKPDSILYELLEDRQLIESHEKNNFLLNDEEKNFSIISKYSELKQMVKLSIELKIPLIGIDLKNMGRINSDFLKKEKLTQDEELEETKLLERREIHQVKKINELMVLYDKIIISLGAYHLRKGAPIAKLEGNFLYVYPCLNGEPIFEPLDNQEECEFKIFDEPKGEFS